MTALLLFACGSLAVVGGGVVVSSGLALGAASLLFLLRRAGGSPAAAAAPPLAIHRRSPVVVVMHDPEDAEPTICADHVLLSGLSENQAMQVLLAREEGQA